jgi:hypothetical protein
VLLHQTLLLKVTNRLMVIHLLVVHNSLLEMDLVIHLLLRHSRLLETILSIHLLLQLKSET